MGMDFCKKIIWFFVIVFCKKIFDFLLEFLFGINFIKMKKKIVLKIKIIVVVELIFYVILISYLLYGKIFF